MPVWRVDCGGQGNKGTGKIEGKARFFNFSVCLRFSISAFQLLPNQSHCGLQAPAQAAISATPMCAPKA